MMYLQTKLAFLLATAWIFSPVDGAFSYTCHPNKTISVTGLPTNYSSMNYFAYQPLDGKNCTVTGDSAAGTADISSCEKNVPIYFTFSTYDGMLENQIQGGKEVQVHNITCFEITGPVNASFSNTLKAIIPFNDTAMVNVTYSITSSLNVSSAYVGEPVEWSIYFPSSYFLEVTSCAAYPGKSSSTNPSTFVSLTSLWCSAEHDLISNFSTNADNTVASAVLRAFKFFNYDSIYLTCDVKACPKNSQSCDTVCGSRRKRSSGDSSGGYETQVGRILYVIDPNTASVKQLPILLMSLLLMALAAVM